MDVSRHTMLCLSGGGEPQLGRLQEPNVNGCWICEGQAERTMSTSVLMSVMDDVHRGGLKN